MTRPPAAGGRFHGFVVIDKPAGWTSHDVVGRVRRILGERKVGHAGTLDPAATGVLPVAVGTATRVVEYLADASKGYLAEITFGIETDTYDADGRVRAVADATGLNASAVESALATFRGPQLQVPPMYSALRVGGERLYDAARRGEEVSRPPRAVTFFRLDLLRWEGTTATVAVECSKGTYVRSLAFDLGRRLGVGAHLSDLVRTRTGPFTLCDAWTLDSLRAAGDDLDDTWDAIAYHPDSVISHLPSILLSESRAREWRQGKAVAGAPDDGLVRAYDDDGAWLGIGGGDAAAGVWRPSKVVGGEA